MKASIVAAVHLLSIELAQGAAVPTTATDAIELAGAGRSQAYSMLGRLRAGVETLARPAGRPAEPKADSDKLLKLAKSVISFLDQHPGSCSSCGGRTHYHDDFRRFVVDMFAPGGQAANIPVGQVADAIDVPLGTLEDWLHAALSAPTSTDSSEHQDSSTEPLFSTTQPQIATLLAEYPNWEGTRSCNLAPEVEQALSCSELLHSAPGRPQAKAPVEGHFGLFEQMLPSPMVVVGDNDADLAASIAELVARAFFVGRNGRPTRRLGGRTPADSWNSSGEPFKPTPRWSFASGRPAPSMQSASSLRRSSPLYAPTCVA